MSKLIVENIHKKFKNEIVLEDISFELCEGEILGIIGRNGSGKTVLLKIICGLLSSDNGKVIYNDKIIGKDCDFPENVGAIIETPSFMKFSSGYKNLKYLADINSKIGKAEIYNAMEQVGLDPSSKKWVVKYSLGMKQRLGIAQAIMENPDLIVLDEPMNGIDKDAVDKMRNYLLEQKKAGKIILLASHIKEDIELLCDKVIELDKGRIVNA